ncbi:MAG: putative inorganic carbon transporter subunit DabA, partial [Hyphococcus sp.]
AVAVLPENPHDLLAVALSRLGVSPEATIGYFHRLLTSIAGWAGHARYRGWFAELHGQSPSEVVEMLAIRAAYDLALMDCVGEDLLNDQWRASLRVLEQQDDDQQTDEIALILQNAMEIAYRGRTTQAIAENVRAGAASGEDARPSAQAVFCIDVRSERMRRALEAANPAIETFGFAGFFGFPIEVARLGETSGAAQCPVLLEPAFTVREQDDAAALLKKNTFASVLSAWKSFKNAAVSSFAFVEAWGLGFLGAILRDTAKRATKETETLRPLSIEPETCSERSFGLDLDARIATAKGALAGMSLTSTHARLVLLVGHGSTTVNNPYASGLDCGACGGHTGEANARVAAAALNDPMVRQNLALEGQALPDDTHFVAALHDTTTDDITLLDQELIPASHAADLQRLKQDIGEAARLVRRERAPTLGLAHDAADDDVISRSRDWSQVRPEWGLAGCAAFIAGPRGRTRGVDLGGRAFLHSYDWRADEDGSVLELIMTAPLVVASWISLQYYGSTVDNKAFGSGDKTLHNVVGGLGVLEGNAGDLRSGLPLQSVHDGARPFHEPLRLCAMIEAPIEAINRVLEKHENVRALFDNHWLRLVAIEDDGSTFKRYDGDLQWSTLDTAEGTAAATANAA